MPPSSYVLCSRASYDKMDLEKRKHEADDNDDAENKITNKKKATAEPEDDEEVEQFFAILRRIRAAVKYFERDHGSGRSLTVKVWEPSFQADDFEGGGGDDHKAGVQDPTAESSGLDLKSEPAPSSCNNATSVD